MLSTAFLTELYISYKKSTQCIADVQKKKKTSLLKAQNSFVIGTLLKLTWKETV